MFTQLYRQSISYILSPILLSNMLYADGIVVDTSAAQKYQAMMDTTANHIPLINIVKPNGNGLSHNKFKEFNVESQGIILNNATGAVSTQLGGWVQGNANLGSTPARVILNEVTGTNRSLLYGYTEVAGHSADVIVANPNGITVNGGGFINTSRATLTTGAAVLNGETLEGFHVQRGDILIDGEGMNADNIDRVELYTKALMLNAALYTGKLDVVTGENTIARDGTVASDNVVGSEEFSIDSTLLGGIYGSTIRLVATDKGVGVNLPPITYAGDSLDLSADGKIVLSKIVADQRVAVDSSSSDITVTEDITANNISMNADKKISITNDRIVKAFNDMTVNAGESIINEGEVNALLGTGTTTVTTLDLSNTGLIGGYDVTINSDAIDNVGALYAKNDLSVGGKMLDSSGVIRSNHDMNLLIEDTLTNQKEGIIYSDGALSIAANGAKDKINTIDNIGLIQSGSTLDISADTLNNLGDAPVIDTVVSSTQTDTIFGSVYNHEKVTVTTTTDIVEVPGTPALILSLDDMSIDARFVNNQYSLIATDENMILNADEVKNVGNVLEESIKTLTEKYLPAKISSKGGTDTKLISLRVASLTTEEISRLPLSSAGIIARNGISGNVVTLNNLTDPLSNVLNPQQIQENLLTINGLETSSLQLQESTAILQNANIMITDSIGETSNIDAIIADALIKNDLNVFNENMTLLQTDLHQAITDSSDSISALESLIVTIKTQSTAEGASYDTAALEATLTQLKNNTVSVEQYLNEIETLHASIQTLNDLQTQKSSLLDNDQAIRTLMIENTDALNALDIAPLISGFETASNTLRSEVNSALALQENVEYKIITQDEGLYQTNLRSTLVPNPAVAYSESTEAIIDGITLPQGKYGLFLVNQDLDHPYLIEQNPLYTNYNTFISSDYILQRLGFDPDNTLKRLGDGAYETQLVRDSVIRLSGNRYLGQYASDTEQYQALMDNALRIQTDLGLVVGVALTQDQIAGLEDNIVWLEERTIEGIKVLVPRVYLASGTLDEAGPKIAANTIALNIGNALTNDGVIHASDTLSFNAKSIKNINGTLSSGGGMALQTQGDLTNTSGTISSGGDMNLLAGGAITGDVASRKIRYDYAGGVQTTTQKGKASQISAGGNLSAQADQSITLSNAEVKADGDVALLSQNGDIDVKAFKTDDAYSFRFKNGYARGDSTTYEASTLSGKNVLLGADKITIAASSLNAQGDLLVAGSGGVDIVAQNDHTFTDTQIKSSSGFLGSKTQKDTVYKEKVVGSTLNAQNVLIVSGEDTTLQAADLKAVDTIAVDAAGDINVLAASYREGELHSVTKSSFGGLVSSSAMNSKDALNLHEATLKTEAKNIIMNSGKDINVIASEINSAADVQLKAFENLNIIAGEEVKSEKHESQKSSFNPLGLLSLVGIDAGPIYTQDIHNKDNYDTTAKSSSITAGGNITADTGTTNIVGSNLNAAGDVTIKADIGGINVASAGELHNASTLDKKVEVKLTDVFTSSADAFTNAHKMDDTKLKFNVASATFDESTTSAQSVKNVGSSITSGKNVTLDSSDDLTIKGSNVTAADTIDLKSKTGNIAVLESVDTTNTQNKEKHASAEVNLVVQNEYVEAAVAVNNAVKAAEQLKQTKEDYSNYKREVKKLEASLETLKKDPQVSESNISNLQALIAATKDDEAYYLAAIAAATVDLASKSVAIAQQASAAGASTATLGFSAGLSLDVQGSQSDTTATATKSNASNLTATNINIATDNTADTSVTVSGSNVNAADTLNIDTHDLNVIASTDTATTDSSSKDISGSISMTVYGAASGPQVSLGYGQNEARSNSTTHTNSTLTGNTVNLNATNDATFKGATVRADDTLNVNVGNNLAVESVQDTASSSNHGFNISGGFGIGGNTSYANTDIGLRTGNGKVESVNGGLGASSGRSYDTQTVLTSLSGDSVNVTTGKDTKLSGAVIAATDAQGNDTGKLNLSTNTLTTENLTDTHYNSQSGFSVGANIGLTPATKDPKPDTKDTQTPSGTKINSEHLALNTSTDTSVGKTLATLGEGNVAIGDTANSSDTTNLNRDVTKVDKELYSSSTGTNVDATVDNRMFTENGQNEIKNQNKELAGNVINGVALSGNIITGNMDVDNAIASFQDPTKMADALKSNPDLAATIDAFSKGQFDNLPKTKEGLQTLADATGLKVDVLLTTVTSYQDAKGTTDKNLIALDVNPTNRADIVGTLEHEINHNRGGTSETLADMSGYATQLLGEAAIGSYDQQYLNGIKFEMGTGQDSTTQVANQVLLGNDNQTLMNAQADHEMEFYNAAVYSRNGKFLGTDDQGIKTPAIIMDSNNFTQGMSHDDALKYSLGYDGLEDDTAKNLFNKSYLDLKNRPDADGYVSISEGIQWAKEHPNLIKDGKVQNPSSEATRWGTLYLDASKLDFGTTTINDLSLGKNGYTVNLLNHTDFTSQASIDTTYALGRVDVNIVNRDKGIISVINNNGTIYDWDKGGGILRSTLINLERFRAGVNDTNGFPLWIYGTTTLDKPKTNTTEVPYVFGP